MKPIQTIVVCILLLSLFLGLAACKPTEQTVVPGPDDADPVWVTLSFVVDDDFGQPAPASQQVAAGTAGGDLAVPAGITVPEHYCLCWFWDEATTLPYRAEDVIVKDTTLYLGVIGEQYTITYRYPAGTVFDAELPTTYRYGEGCSLPRPVLGQGYNPYGNGDWQVGDTDSYIVAVPATQVGNLVLTMHPLPLQYSIAYSGGTLDGQAVDWQQVYNPNPDLYTLLMGEVYTLQPVVYMGRTSTGWQLDLSGPGNTFVIDGQTVTLTNHMRIDKLSFDMIVWGRFSLRPLWD